MQRAYAPLLKELEKMREAKKKPVAVPSTKSKASSKTSPKKQTNKTKGGAAYLEGIPAEIFQTGNLIGSSFKIDDIVRGPETQILGQVSSPFFANGSSYTVNNFNADILPPLGYNTTALVGGKKDSAEKKTKPKPKSKSKPKSTKPRE